MGDVIEIHFGTKKSAGDHKSTKGDLVLLFRYHSIIELIHKAMLHRRPIRLTCVEPWVLLEPHDMDKILRKIQKSVDLEYLDMLELHAKNHLIVETELSKRLLQPIE